MCCVVVEGYFYLIKGHTTIANYTAPEGSSALAWWGPEYIGQIQGSQVVGSGRGMVGFRNVCLL